jgi:hypothetical protein
VLLLLLWLAPGPWLLLLLLLLYTMKVILAPGCICQHCDGFSLYQQQLVGGFTSDLQVSGPQQVALGGTQQLPGATARTAASVVTVGCSVSHN